MFKIWVVEDNRDVKDRIADMLFYTFGPQERATAQWQVFGMAKDVLGRIIHAKPVELPDVAIVDVALESPDEIESKDLVGDSKDIRGLLVAAALQSYTRGSASIVLYTGSPVIRQELKERFLDLPPGLQERGVRPLIQIKVKGEGDAHKEIRGWIANELRPLSRRAMASRGCSGKETQDILPVFCRFQDLAAKECELLKALEPVCNAVQGILEEYEALPKAARVRQRCSLDVSRLRHSLQARPDNLVDGLRLTFQPPRSKGWPIERWARDVAPHCAEMSSRIAAEYTAHFAEMERLLEELRKLPWYPGIRLIAPMECATIEWFSRGFGLPKHSAAACRTALTELMSLLGFVDHTASLARAFLHLSGDGGDRVPTTAFAHACHQWSRPQHWTYGVDYNVSDDDRQHYLAQELDLESGGPFPKLLLPERSRKNIVDLGKEFNSDLPLVGFATNWNNSAVNRYWLDDPKRRLRTFGWDAEWAEECADPEGIYVLTDWNLLFADHDSLISELMTAAETEDPLRVVVALREGRKLVSIRFEFNKAFTKAAINLKVQCGGGTTAVLRKFLNWGELMVISTTPAGSYQARRGVDPTQLQNFSGAPFQVELTLTNYNETRLTGDET